MGARGGLELFSGEGAPTPLQGVDIRLTRPCAACTIETLEFDDASIKLQTHWIEREIQGELRRLVDTFPVVVLVGPRQVGKTSVAERALPGFGSVSLDLASLADLADRSPQTFLDRYPSPLLIDEVQYAPGLFRALKHAVEQRRGQNGLFVLTGSQSFPLMHAVSDSLAGRAAIVPLLGLSGGEWRAGCPAETSWRDFLWRGAWPALWADPDGRPTRDRWYQGYVATYLERDLRNVLNVGSLRDFERFLRVCAARTGQVLNISDMARDVGIAPATGRVWLSVLQAANLIVLLEPYHRSFGKRLAKSPKLHMTDSGLAAYLMGFQSAEALWTSPQAGALWESYVVGQWLRWRDWHHPSVNLWYWRDDAGHEVDLVVEADGKLHPIECKLAERPDASDLKGIDKLRRFYGDEALGSASVACPIGESYEVAKDTWVRSGWVAWEDV